MLLVAKEVVVTATKGLNLFFGSLLLPQPPCTLVNTEHFSSIQYLGLRVCYGPGSGGRCWFERKDRGPASWSPVEGKREQAINPGGALDGATARRCLARSGDQGGREAVEAEEVCGQKDPVHSLLPGTWPVPEEELPSKLDTPCCQPGRWAS